MNTCPHCGARASALRLAVMTRKSPYRCPRCGESALLQPEHNTFVALLMLAGVFLSGMAIYPLAGFGWGVAGFLATYLIIVLVMVFFVRLEKHPRP